MQRAALGDVQSRFYNGIPTPQSEQMAGGIASALPGFAGQQINVDPLRGQSLQQTAQMGQQTFDPGVAGLQQFASGELGNSPAIQAAVNSISQSVVPQLQNRMQSAGLGRSGAMMSELQQGMTGTLLPLYMQGLQQQQGAATQLSNMGLGLEGLRAQQAQLLGSRSEELGTQAMNRGLAAVLQGTLPTLQELGQRDAARDSQRIQDAFTGGALDRDIAGQMAQAQHADMLRQQALAETFHTALLGSIPSFTAFPQTQTETYRTPSSK